MEDYIRARPDVFFTGARRQPALEPRALLSSPASTRVDLFIGSTLQMDADGNSSTVTLGRLAGFGGAPNMGSDPQGRRHSSAAWLDMITRQSPIARGRKLVVQIVETFHKGGEPSIVETLDAVEVGKKGGMPIAPVMIYGDDVTHVVTEEGIAYLYKTEGLEERKAAIAAIAGATEIGLRADPEQTAESALPRHRGHSRGPRRPSHRRQPDAAGRAQHRRPRGVVRGALSAARPIPELVNLHECDRRPAKPERCRSGPDRDALTAHKLSTLAVAVLIEEAELTPKPALVDRRGNGAHHDLDLARLRLSAGALQDGFTAIARTAIARRAVAAAARTARADRSRDGATDAGGYRWQQRPPRRDLGTRIAGRRRRPAPFGEPSGQRCGNGGRPRSAA